jgi:hypothetical protein
MLRLEVLLLELFEAEFVITMVVSFFEVELRDQRHLISL